jgi:hypothetical protein
MPIVSPLGGSEQITPSDSAGDNFDPCTQLWVGGAGGGDLALVFTDESVCEMIGVVVGMYTFPPFVRVNDTNTDVSAMVAFRGLVR